MLDRQTRLQEINSLNLQTFAEKLSWHSNGVKGQLHVDRTCGKVKRKTAIIRHITLANALSSNVVCYDCMRQPEWNATQRQIWDDSDELLQRRSRYQVMLMEPISEMAAMPALKNWRLTQVAAYCQNDLDNYDSAPGLDPWKKQISEYIQSQTPQTVQLDVVAAEALRWAATAVLLGELVWHTEDHSLFGGGQVIDTFEEPEKSDFDPDRKNFDRNPIGGLALAWITLLRDGHQPEAATAILLDDAYKHRDELFGNPKREFLKRCPMTQAAKPGHDAFDLTESMWDYQQRIWHQHALVAAKLLLDTWSKHLATLVAPAAPVLCDIGHAEQDVLIDSATSTNIGVIISGTLNWTLRKQDWGYRGVIMCHPTLGAYIYSRLHSIGGSSIGVKFGRPIQIDKEPTKTELENTVALWDPDDTDSVYFEIVDAFSAATKL